MKLVYDPAVRSWRVWLSRRKLQSLPSCNKLYQCLVTTLKPGRARSRRSDFSPAHPAHIVSRRGKIFVRGRVRVLIIFMSRKRDSPDLTEA
jgi:hypothetical protein